VLDPKGDVSGWTVGKPYHWLDMLGRVLSEGQSKRGSAKPDRSSDQRTASVSVPIGSVGIVGTDRLEVAPLLGRKASAFWPGI
jgi:hypothetical protein